MSKRKEKKNIKLSPTQQERKENDEMAMSVALAVTTKTVFLIEVMLKGWLEAFENEGGVYDNLNTPEADDIEYDIVEAIIDLQSALTIVSVFVSAKNQETFAKVYHAIDTIVSGDRTGYSYFTVYAEPFYKDKTDMSDEVKVMILNKLNEELDLTRVEVSDEVDT
ncbi:MAG: hypothetical protein EOM41_08510 [Bacilli bacterium]|nr:hypothetical protein [Bacilli bacterium]